jgi:hypothetical protein
MPQIDPKFTFWFGVWTNILLLIAGLGIDHAPAVIAQYAPDVQWVCGVFYKINFAILTALTGLSSNRPGPFITVPPPSIIPTIVKILIVAFALSALLGAPSVQAQTRTRIKPLQVTGDPVADFKANTAQAAAAVTGQPPAPLVCDFHIFEKLKPDNLIDVIKTCINTQKQELVDDTQRALDSAKSFTPNPDQDAINCLTPGVALFKAAVPLPAIPARDAVPATATTPEIPAVVAIPEREPGLILIFQKYREFVLAGALTSCQAWVNAPVNATASAGIGAAAGVAGAAVLLPK